MAFSLKGLEPQGPLHAGPATTLAAVARGRRITIAQVAGGMLCSTLLMRYAVTCKSYETVHYILFNHVLFFLFDVYKFQLLWKRKDTFVLINV